MKYLKVILFSFFIVFMAVVIFGVMLSSDWEVERSITINTKPEKIYPYVANFKTGWTQWSTFDFGDQNIKYSYSGPEEGVGAIRSWASEKVGPGSQTITHADPHRGVAFDVRFEDPNFTLKGTIRFEPTMEGTQVTWRDYGNAGTNPFAKYSAFTMDRWLGDDFEKSLKLLKEKVEAEP